MTSPAQSTRHQEAQRESLARVGRTCGTVTEVIVTLASMYGISEKDQEWAIRAITTQTKALRVALVEALEQ